MQRLIRINYENSFARERGHEIVSIIDIDNQEDFESEAFASADVAIEFTAPQAAYGNFLKCFAKGVKVVSGSTGWKKDHQADVERLIGEGNTLFLAKIMNGFPQYDAHMEETHHIHKIDAPSGTAITLAEGILENLDRKTSWIKGEENKPYDPQTLRIDSLRRGEVPGIHTVRYDSEADCITITHDAHSRKGFALGAVLAAEYTKEHQGLLTIEDMFNF